MDLVSVPFQSDSQAGNEIDTCFCDGNLCNTDKCVCTTGASGGGANRDVHRLLNPMQLVSFLNLVHSLSVAFEWI